jgi:predicted dehydrogenase
MPSVSLIGCGRWGRNILRDLLALGCQVAVCDPDLSAREYAQAAGASAVASVHELSTSDGMVIATPVSTHAAVIRLGLGSGIPIFVEKPLTSDVEAAREFAEIARGRLFVMDKWRYHPGIEELARIARTGELGAPLGMRLRQVGWGTPHLDVDVTWVLLPHCLAIALEVLGAVPAPRYAFATMGGTRVVSLDGMLGDDGMLGERPWVSVEVSERNPVKVREFQLHCEDGVAWLDEGWTDHISIARGGVIEKRNVAPKLPLYAELEAFVRHLDGGPAPRSSVEEGAQVVEAISELRFLAGLAR